MPDLISKGERLRRLLNNENMTSAWKRGALFMLAGEFDAEDCVPEALMPEKPTRHPNSKNLYCIQNLRDFVEETKDEPGERSVMVQVVAVDGTVWNMWPYITHLGPGKLNVITCWHPDLPTLPKP